MKLIVEITQLDDKIHEFECVDWPSMGGGFRNGVRHFS